MKWGKMVLPAVHKEGKQFFSDEYTAVSMFISMFKICLDNIVDITGGHLTYNLWLLFVYLAEHILTKHFAWLAVY